MTHCMFRRDASVVSDVSCEPRALQALLASHRHHRQVVSGMTFDRFYCTRQINESQLLSMGSASLGEIVRAGDNVTRFERHFCCRVHMRMTRAQGAIRSAAKAIISMFQTSNT